MPYLEGDKMLVRAMAQLGATENEILMMMLILEQKEQKKQMLLWLYDHRTATSHEMLQASVEISGIKQRYEHDRKI